jgi:hypothetical protein
MFYTILTLLVHALVGSAAALAIAPYSMDAAATSKALLTLGIASAFLSSTGFVGTRLYLGKRVKTFAGAQVGLLCGLLCAGILALALTRLQFSLVVYLALIAPALLAVLLATLLDRSKSGWQS